MSRGTQEEPIYSLVPDSRSQNFWAVVCDEGWRQSIVCTGMYKWAADWFISEVQGKPFALDTRP